MGISIPAQKPLKYLNVVVDNMGDSGDKGQKTF